MHSRAPSGREPCLRCTAPHSTLLRCFRVRLYAVGRPGSPRLQRERVIPRCGVGARPSLATRLGLLLGRGRVVVGKGLRLGPPHLHGQDVDQRQAVTVPGEGFNCQKCCLQQPSTARSGCRSYSETDQQICVTISKCGNGHVPWHSITCTVLATTATHERPSRVQARRCTGRNGARWQHQPGPGSDKYGRRPVEEGGVAGRDT